MKFPAFPEVLEGRGELRFPLPFGKLRVNSDSRSFHRNSRTKTTYLHIMKKVLLAVVLLTILLPAKGQSKTTLGVEEEYEASLTLFFYKNTLRMLNQQDNPEFDELIRDIEKMKFLVVDKTKGNFGKEEYRKLINEYQEENFEAIVTSRIDGRNFDIYLRDNKGKPGTVVLVNDSSSLYILDMVGKIDVSKAGTLMNVIDGNTDIGKRIKGFTERDSDSGKKRKHNHFR